MEESHKTTEQLISEINLLKAQLEQKNLIARLIDNSEEIIYRYSFIPEPRFEFVSNSATKITGYTPQEHYDDPKLGLKIVHPDDRHLLESTFNLSDPDIKPLELRWIIKDGSIIWTEQINKPIFNDEGKLAAIEGSARDITKRKTAKLSLTESQERYKTLFQGSPDAIFLADFDTGLIVDANVAAEKLLKKSHREIVGLHQSQLHYPNREDSFTESFHQHKIDAEKGVPTRHLETTVLRSDGTEIPVDIMAHMVHINGKPLLQGVFRDITVRKEKERIQDQSREYYKSLFENSQSIMLLIDPENGDIVDVNIKACVFYGYSKEEFITKKITDLNTLSQSEAFDKMRAAKTQQSNHFEFKHRLSSGEIREIETYSSPVLIEGKHLLYSIVHDISERKKIEEQLRESREMLHAIMDNSPVVLHVKNCQSQFTMISRQYEKIFGIKNEDILNKTPHDFMPKEIADKLLEDDRFILINGIPSQFEHKIIHLDGAHTYITTKFPLFDSKGTINGICGISIDITERKAMEEMIRASLKEKELLLGEIHHRVKNNMAIVVSILSMQRSFVTDDKHLELFMEGENRIKSMALIHEKLYSSKNLSTVDFKEYIHSLTTTLFIAYKINSSKISLNIDIKNVALGIDMAVPCGLLLNELISNSLKHGFKDGRTGEIFVGMCYISDGRIELIVRDNGVGIPKDIDIRNTESLGWQLIIGLGESQLGGKIEVNIENGTEIKVRFSDNIKTNQLV